MDFCEKYYFKVRCLTNSDWSSPTISSPQPGEYGDLDLPLPGVAGVVLQDLDGHDLVGAFLPALGHLGEE